MVTRFYGKFINIALFDKLKVLSNFRWAEFTYPSTLHLSGFLPALIEPVNKDKLIMEKVELGLHEALVNAVKHGNLSDPSKRLRVRRIITPNWFVWQVQDQGKGTPNDFRKGILPERLEVDSGRGLYMIYQCFDDVRWSSKGNRLQLSLKRDF
tara:strand:- start:359 stop:817 length:459 start_codon:yes stop_codon:yes gene_type:complete